MTEERLIELLQQSTHKEVKVLSQKLNIEPTGSKLEIIMQIKREMQKDNSKFKKVFTKLWGCSGGWVSAACPHGIVYAIKFVLHAESPRDHVDVLLSVRHQPIIVISDMANIVVAHGNNRKYDMFSPNNGMLIELTEENIESAVE